MQVEKIIQPENCKQMKSINENILEDYSRYCIIAMLIGISVSTAGANIALAGFLVFALLSNKLQREFYSIISCPITRSSLVLFAVLCASVAWSEAQSDIAWQWVSKYKKLLLIPLVAPFFQEREHKILFFKGLLASLVIGLFISYLNYFRITSIGNCPSYGCSTHSYITLAMLNCLLLLISSAYLFFSVTSKRDKLYAFLLATLTLINVMFVLPSRTGQLMVFCLIASSPFFVWGVPEFADRHKKGNFLICMILLMGLLGGSVFVLKGSRLVESIQKIVVYKEEALRSTDLNVAVDVRSEMFRKTLVLITEKPFLGWGAGGQEAELIHMSGQGMTENEKYIFANPHNEYLTWAVQTGVLGLVVFLYWLATVWRQTLKVEDSISRAIMAGWLLIFTLGCFFNSFLLDFSEGYTTVLLIAVSAAIKKDYKLKGTG